MPDLDLTNPLRNALLAVGLLGLAIVILPLLARDLRQRRRRSRHRSRRRR